MNPGEVLAALDERNEVDILQKPPCVQIVDVDGLKF
jgi:hypothetical protein